MESTSYWESSRAVPPPDATSVGRDRLRVDGHPRAAAATAIACGLPPTAIVAIVLSVRGSMRVTVPSPLFGDPHRAGADRDPGRGVPDRDRRRHRPRARIDPDDRVVERVGHPHAALADRDPAWPIPDRDRVDQARSGPPG